MFLTRDIDFLKRYLLVLHQLALSKLKVRQTSLEIIVGLVMILAGSLKMLQIVFQYRSQVEQCSFKQIVQSTSQVKQVSNMVYLN